MNIINNVQVTTCLVVIQSPWGFRHQGTLSAYADSKAGRNIVRREFKCRGLKTELARRRTGKRQSQSIFRLFFAATVEGRYIFCRPRCHHDDAMMVRARLIPCVTERAVLVSINNVATVIQSHLQSIRGRNIERREFECRGLSWAERGNGQGSGRDNHKHIPSSSSVQRRHL